MNMCTMSVCANGLTTAELLGVISMLAFSTCFSRSITMRCGENALNRGNTSSRPNPATTTPELDEPCQRRVRTSVTSLATIGSIEAGRGNFCKAASRIDGIAPNTLLAALATDAEVGSITSSCFSRNSTCSRKASSTNLATSSSARAFVAMSRFAFRSTSSRMSKKCQSSSFSISPLRMSVEKIVVFCSINLQMSATYSGSVLNFVSCRSCLYHLIIVSHGTPQKLAFPYTMMPTGSNLESGNSLFAVFQILWPRLDRTVTAESAASATASLLRIAISAVTPNLLTSPPPPPSSSPARTSASRGPRTPRGTCS